MSDFPVRYHCGIDPGQSGAICILDTQVPEDSPPLLIGLWKLNEVTMAAAIQKMDIEGQTEWAHSRVLIEQEHGRPHDTPTTAFGLGRSVGMVQGSLCMAEIYAHFYDKASYKTVHYVPPQTWMGSEYVHLSRSMFNKPKELAWEHVKRTWLGAEHLIQDYVGNVSFLDMGNKNFSFGAWFPEYCLDSICLALHSIKQSRK